MGLSREQIARRLEGITATDVAAIVGVHPYRSRIDVWREKRGEAPPWVDTDRSRWGELLEPVIRSDYAERHNVRVEVPGTLEHPDEPWMLATPDGVAYTGESPINGLEIKCHTFRIAHQYGAPGTDEIPLHELCQDTWNLAVSGLERWDHVVFLDGQPTEYVVMRDDELIGGLREQAERFLIDNVRGGAVPEPDGSASFDRWLHGKWPVNAGGLVDLAASTELNVAAIHTDLARAKEIREVAADLDREHEQIIQRLKLVIADRDGLTWSNAKEKPEKLTWKRNKPSKVIDYTGMATDARRDASLTVSARKTEIERALICLRSLGQDYIGRSTQAVITGTDVAELVALLQSTLATIATRTDAAYTTEIPGKRPFCFPRTWKAPASAKE